MPHIRLGIDVGGTFTDFSLIDDAGEIILWKEATTPADPGLAIRDGLAALAETRGLEIRQLIESLDLFVHGQTIATNTVIQRNGPKTGLLCTEGFRDVLYIRDEHRYDMFDPQIEYAEPLVPREHTHGITERVLADGRVHTVVDQAQVEALATELIGKGIQSVTVCLLNAYVNGTNERAVRAATGFSHRTTMRQRAAHSPSLSRPPYCLSWQTAFPFSSFKPADSRRP